MAQTAAAKLVKANYDKRELKSENSDLRKEISAQKRDRGVDARPRGIRVVHTELTAP